MNDRFITKVEEDGANTWKNIGVVGIMTLFLICIVGMAFRNEPVGSHMLPIILVPIVPAGLGLLCTWFIHNKGKKAVEKRQLLMDKGRMTLGYVKQIKETTVGGRNQSEKCLKYTIVYDLENGEGQKEWESPYYRKSHSDVLRENGFCKLHVYNNEVCLDEDQTREIPVFGESSNYWRHY